MSEVKKTKRKPTGAAAMGAGPGRPKGSTNKTTRALKDMILGALEGAGDAIEPGGGGQAYLQKQADENPGPFLSLIGKVLPSEINATLGNPDGSNLNITVNFVKANHGG
jgi:hypothetical protein